MHVNQLLLLKGMAPNPVAGRLLKGRLSKQRVRARVTQF